MGAPNRTLVVALSFVVLLLAGCGTDDDGVAVGTGPGGLPSGGPTGSVAASPPGGASGEPADAGPAADPTDIPTQTPPPPPAFPTATPDPETWPAASEPPTVGYYLLGAEATVELAGATHEFFGLGPEVAMLIDALEEENYFGNGQDFIASCGFHPTTQASPSESPSEQAQGGRPLVTADFHRERDYEAADSFSFADNADGTVLWGLHLAGPGEEWTGTGSGQADITVMQPPVAFPDYEFIRDYVFGEYVWSGTATENFSLEKRPFTSTIVCIWAPAKTLEPLREWFYN